MFTTTEYCRQKLGPVTHGVRIIQVQADCLQVGDFLALGMTCKRITEVKCGEGFTSVKHTGGMARYSNSMQVAVRVME